jgi:hypothetical protein
MMGHMGEVLGRLSSERRDELRARLVAAMPRWYSPWLHLGFPSLVGLTTMAACVWLLPTWSSSPTTGPCARCASSA